MRYLIFAYPVLVHAAIVTDSTLLKYFSLMAMAALLLTAPLTHRRAWAWMLLVLIAVGGGYLAEHGGALYFLYLPPVLLNLFLMWLFADSMREGRTPLISTVAHQIRGDLPTPIAAYTRRLTGVWAGLFGLMASWSLLAAIAAPAELWSWITNVFNYLFVAVIFVLEYFYRMWRFRDLPHPNLKQFLLGMGRVNFRRKQ